MKKSIYKFILIFFITLLTLMISTKIALNKENTEEIHNTYEENNEQNMITEQEYIPTQKTEMQIDSKEIQQLIENDWYTSKVNFGTEESTFENYTIYFDEGIETRTIARKSFNIIFTDKYTKSIINGLKVGDSFEKIIKELGNPSFGNENDEVIGYLGNEIYIFFSKQEVSIYRAEKKEEDYTDFISLIMFYDQNKQAWDFGNGLSELWKDYDKYNYGQDYADLIYSLRGVRLQFNYTTRNGITFYKNYTGEILEGMTIQDLASDMEYKPDYIHLELEKDLVYETELERYSKFYYIKNPTLVEGDETTQKKEQEEFVSSQFRVDAEKENDRYKNIKIISLSGEHPRAEITRDKEIDSYIWFDETHLLYSIKQKGIYLYDCITREIHTVLEGNEKFNLKKVDKSVLTYDEETVEIIL